MQVILLEKVRNLGDLGDTVNVKSGYSRNYLIPQGKAVFANKKNLAVFEARRVELEKKAKEKKEAAEKRAETLQGINITIEALASEEGKLYGSVGPDEIMKAINDASVEVTRREIDMPMGVINTIGEYDIELQLHSDVVVKKSVKVVELKK